MIKLHEKPPEGVTYNGRFYRCNFDFRNVLKMLDIMQRDDLLKAARDYLCIKCVYSHKIPSKIASGLYDALCNLLFEKPEKTGNKRLTSWEQDAPLIRAAFRQVYHINLFTDRLSWFEFVELIQALPEGCRYEEVIGIRARPIPPPTKYNQKEREWLIAAKQSVALELTEQEKEDNYNNMVSRVFDCLMSMIPDKKEVNAPNE